MLNDGQMRALKERHENHQDLWLRTSAIGCQRVSAVHLEWAPLQEQVTLEEPFAMLADSSVVPLRAVHLTDFVTLKPWDGSREPVETDKLTMLQDAARDGLDVNFLTGDVSLPKGTPLGPAAAR